MCVVQQNLAAISSKFSTLRKDFWGINIIIFSHYKFRKIATKIKLSNAFIWISPL